MYPVGLRYVIAMISILNGWTEGETIRHTKCITHYEKWYAACGKNETD